MKKLLALFGLDPVWDVADWKQWWSTRLAALQVALGGAAVAFHTLPLQWQQELPDWLGVALGAATILVGFLTPPAAAAVQPKLRK